MVSLRGRRMIVLVAGVLLCSLLVGGVSASGENRLSETHSFSEAQVANVESDSFEADRTVFIITVRENGSAEWRFRYEQRLETDAEIEDFRTYADRFNTEETDSFVNFQERAVALTASGTNATDREMEAERFRRDARIEERPPAGDEFAVIEMSFEWTNFALIDGDEVIAGDVFTGGLYVGPEQQLRFDRGANLQFESTAPEPDSTSADTLAESETITWIGERSFADREPRVTFVERGTDPTPAENESGQDDSDQDGPEQDASEGDDPEQDGSEPDSDTSDDTMGSVIPFVALGLVIFLGLGAAIAYRAGVLPGGTGEVDASRPGETTYRGGDTDAAENSPGGAEPNASTIPQSEQGDGGTTPAVTDEQFLSDEERVIALLQAQGGRMKQVDIVDRTDWSKSKVSMLLSEMESEGTISKLRVGRENIVSLAGHEPDAVGSPFDDE